MGTDAGFRFIGTFMEWLAERGFDTHEALYRGQGSKEWGLTPGVFRPGAHGINNERRLNRWIDQAARHADPQPIEDIDWLILAQHHGIPTNLLDWTTNPLTALFFACEEVSESVHNLLDGAVYLAMRDCFEMSDDARRHRPFLERSGFPGLVDAKTKNPRSRAQDSFMSIHTEAISGWGDLRSGFAKFIVPDAVKGDVLEALSRLGFSDDRIYVDIGKVVARSIREYEFEDMVGLN